MDFKLISVDSDYYKQVLELREDILRKPLGRKLTRYDIEHDAQEFIFVLTEKDRVIASVQFRILSDRRLKLRQMAVIPSFQDMGYGSELIQSAERVLVKKGFKEIELHARKHAVDFYLKNGFQIISEEFLEVGIPHVKMFKIIS